MRLSAVRLSDAEREELFEVLSRHAAAGRIELEELERRVAAVAAASSREQAADVLADLPPLGSAEASWDSAATGPGRPRWGRGHAEADRAAAGWRPTAERFRDPKTGRVMRVWVDGAGGRHYIADQ